VLPATLLWCRRNRGHWSEVSIRWVSPSPTGKVTGTRALTLFLDMVDNALDKLNLLRLKKRQGRVVYCFPLEVHEIAPLEVLPEVEQHDCAVMNLLNKCRERMADGAISGFLGPVSHSIHHWDVVTRGKYPRIHRLILLGMPVAIPRGMSGLVEEQKGCQEDGEPSFFVARGKEGVEASEHIRKQPLVDAFAPDAVELGDDHPRHRYAIRERVVTPESWLQPQALLAAEPCRVCPMP
jgi:hypothetical protein